MKMLGKIQAKMDESDKRIETIAAALPITGNPMAKTLTMRKKRKIRGRPESSEKGEEEKALLY